MSLSPEYRPRLSTELTAALRTAAALANLTVPDYLEQVVTPFVRTDLQRRIERKHLNNLTGTGGSND